MRGTAGTCVKEDSSPQCLLSHLARHAAHPQPYADAATGEYSATWSVRAFRNAGRAMQRVL